MKRKIPGMTSILATAMFTLLAANSSAQYKQTDFVSNQPGVAPLQDPSLLNGWGLSRSTTSPFWVSDNVTGKATLYTGGGVKVSLEVTIPPVSGNPHGTPTGTMFNITVGNPTPAFAVSKNGKTAPALFLFATQDGTISGWAPTVDATNAVIGADRSGFGAVYTGLTIASTPGGDFLYAADNGPNSRVDVFDAHFGLVKSFTDPDINGG